MKSKKENKRQPGQILCSWNFSKKSLWSEHFDRKINASRLGFAAHRSLLLIISFPVERTKSYYVLTPEQIGWIDER